jgi:hypothetical protein
MSVTKVALDDLAASIKADLEQADKHVKVLTTWQATAPTGNDLLAAALLLHHLYSAIEAIIERSLKLFDGTPTQGQDWHMRLLELASKEVPDLRPAILPTNEAVDELRRFRHRIRKRYDVDVDPDRLFPVLQTAVAEWPNIRAHIVVFSAFVDECARDAD